MVLIIGLEMLLEVRRLSSHSFGIDNRRNEGLSISLPKGFLTELAGIGGQFKRYDGHAESKTCV